MQTPSTMIDYYAVLDNSPKNSKKIALLAAYKRMLNGERSMEKKRRLAEAYNTLSDEKKRREYDQALKEKESQSPRTKSPEKASPSPSTPSNASDGVAARTTTTTARKAAGKPRAWWNKCPRAARRGVVKAAGVQDKGDACDRSDDLTHREREDDSYDYFDGFIDDSEL